MGKLPWIVTKKEAYTLHLSECKMWFCIKKQHSAFKNCIKKQRYQSVHFFSAHAPKTGQTICAGKAATVIQQNECSGAMTNLAPLVLLKYNRRSELPGPEYQRECLVQNKINSKPQLSGDPLLVLASFGGWGRREYVFSLSPIVRWE